MPDDIVIGKAARVTARIAPGAAGEILLSIRGGAEAYHADSDDVFERGSVVQITDFFPPRTVRVAAPKG